jgi:hypothetical protein
LADYRSLDKDLRPEYNLGWRMPLDWNCIDLVAAVRNIYLAWFLDIGDAKTVMIQRRLN